MYTQPLLVPSFPSNSKISQKNSQLFYEIPSNSQISQKIPSDSKKLFGISWNVLDFFFFLGIHSHCFFSLGIPKNS